MQVGNATFGSGSFSATQVSGALATGLLNFSSTGTSAESLREDWEEEQRRLAAGDVSSVTTGFSGRGTTEIVRQNERAMRPTSRSAREQVQSRQQQQDADQRAAFQRTLDNARQPQTAQQPSKESTQSTERTADSERATTSTKQASSNETQPKDADAKASQRTPDTSAKTPQAATETRPAQAATPATPNLANTPNSNAVRAAAIRSAVTGVSAITAASSSGASSGRAGQSSSQNATAASQTTSTGRTSKATQTAATKAGTKSDETAASKNDAQVERILRVVRSQITEQRAQTTLRLDPPELGTLRLHLDLQRDALTLRVEPTTELAYQLLTKQLDSLRDGLEASGVHLERVEIRQPPEAQPAVAEGQQDVQSDATGSDGQSAADTSADDTNGTGTGSQVAPSRIDGADTTDEERPATESLVDILA